MIIHTLTIDDDVNDTVRTFAFATETEVFDQLREEYPAVAEMDEDDILAELTEHMGVVVYFDTHEVTLPS